MSGERLSATTRALLRGARSDAPGVAARANVWSGVSAAVGGAAGAGAAGAGAAGLGTSGAGLSAAKMLVAGTLLGGVVTVGLAAMLLHIGPSPSHAPPASTAATFGAATMSAPALAAPPAPAPPSVEATAGAGANVMPGVPAAPPTHASTPDGASAVAHAGPGGARHNASMRGPRPAIPSSPSSPALAPSRHTGGDDALTREASLVSAARAALAAGNGVEALRLVREARSMPSPQLVPEELTVEAQALRALGKADDARGVDATLHSQYPDSALAR